MATPDTPEEDPIPDLTVQQYRALNEYTTRHHQFRDKLSTYPMLIARVVADDKRAAGINPVSGIVPDGYATHDEYLPDVFTRMGLAVSQMDGDVSWNVARTSWRLELLPTNPTFNSAYHRRCGIVFGYPPDAIVHFLTADDVNVTYRDIARSGLISGKELAYLEFVPYVHKESVDTIEQLIEHGKMIRARIRRLSEAWELPALDAHAEYVYQEYAVAYSGEGTWDPPMEIDPDIDLSEDDMRSLLS